MPPKEMIRRLSGEKDSKEIANKYAARSYCSLADSAMPKANTRCIWHHQAMASRLRRFSGLRASARLAWQLRLLPAGSNTQRLAFPLKLERSGAYMFDGKNNRLLDSFSFRLALTAAVFAVWSGAGYLLLSLA
jgi:hypothetical protein